MAKPRDDWQKDPFRPPLNQIIDQDHLLGRLAGEIDWSFFEQRFSAVCSPGPGRPPLPTRLVAGLFILKHMHGLSDEVLCARWLENPYLRFRQIGLAPPRGLFRAIALGDVPGHAAGSRKIGPPHQTPACPDGHKVKRAIRAPAAADEVAERLVAVQGRHVLVPFFRLRR